MALVRRGDVSPWGKVAGVVVSQAVAKPVDHAGQVGIGRGLTDERIEHHSDLMWFGHGLAVAKRSTWRDEVHDGPCPVLAHRQLMYPR